MIVKNYELKHPTKMFLVLVLCIIAVGLPMLYSSSFIVAGENYGNSNYFIYKQLICLLIAVPICSLISMTRISFWIKYGLYFHILCLVLLALTLIPSIGVTANGSTRWIRVGTFVLQPGEFVKISLALLSINFFEGFKSLSVREKAIYIALITSSLTLLMFQPDFGTFIISLAVLVCVAFLSSFSRKYLYYSLAGVFLLAVPVLLSQSYRVKRLLTFINPWENPQTSGFQIIQSYLAFANGSVLGQGLGNSNGKLFYLPEAHNDFIFSVIGEEFGLVGVSLVIGAFVALLYYGFRISMQMKHKETYILVSTAIFTIGLQAILNMGVVLGLLPTKGLNLPFISSGGSSLMANCFIIGLVVSAVRSEIRGVGDVSNSDNGAIM